TSSRKAQLVRPEGVQGIALQELFSKDPAQCIDLARKLAGQALHIELLYLRILQHYRMAGSVVTQPAIQRKPARQRLAEEQFVVDGGIELQVDTIACRIERQARVRQLDVEQLEVALAERKLALQRRLQLALREGVFVAEGTAGAQPDSHHGSGDGACPAPPG